jgi:3'-phosphoadenosine 5'-phosphosulfate sulfotransferase
MSIKTFAALAAVLAAAPLAAQTRITPGQTVTGTLDEGDPRMEDGAHYDAYVVRGRPGERLLVRMSSEDFDTYLHWGYEDDEGDWVEEDENDDAGDGTDSRLVIRLDGGGEYELRAAGFDEDEEGDYELRVSPMADSRPVRVRVGQTVDAELGGDDFEGEEGFEDHYVIRGTPGAHATLRAESDDFDTYLRFGEWRDGELDVQGEDDDGGGDGTNSLLLVEFEDDTEYRIVVRAFDGEGGGAYRLTVLDGDQTGGWEDDDADEDFDVDVDVDVDSDDAAEGDWNVDTTAIPPVAMDGDDADEGDWVTLESDSDWPATDSASDYSGMGREAVRVGPLETVESALGEANRQDEDGAYYQDFLYRARAGERLQLRASSGEFDAYLLLGRGTADDFEPVTEDDDGGPALDAQLAWTFRDSGEYTIRVTSAGPEQTGAFILRLLSSR